MQDKYRELLNDYLDDQLSSLEKMLVEEHITSCSACRRELNQLKLLDWELRHQPGIELPPEIASCRIAAIKNYMMAVENGRDNSRVRDFLQLQLTIVSKTSSFISLNPVNRKVKHTIKSSVTVLGKAAGAALKKRKPGLSRLIPGQA